MLWIAAVVLAGALGWALWRGFFAVGSVSTDNAYVQGDVVVVTPQIAGTVLAVHADETFSVSAGQVLVTLDATDARKLLQRKSVELAQAVRQTRGLYLEAVALRSAVLVRQSELEGARAEFERARETFRRREALLKQGAVSREDLEAARAAHESARSGVALAEAAHSAERERLAAHLALIEGVPLERHPAIRRSALEVQEAWLAVKRAEIRAPLSGFVARRNVQIGQRVEAGANLLSLVPLDQVWVEANFKEGQLRDLRIGQPVRLVSDLYGKDVVFEGRVVGLGAGTGAAFSLLPAQNATGNWVKVVQRVPVRISLDPAQLSEHPLRIGLSMRVSVDTRDTEGKRLADGEQGRPEIRTEVFGGLERGADEYVRRIIAEHLSPGDEEQAQDQASRHDGPGRLATDSSGAAARKGRMAATPAPAATGSGLSREPHANPR